MAELKPQDCPTGPMGTHHFIPQGTVESSTTEVCQYCSRSRAELVGEGQ